MKFDVNDNVLKTTLGGNIFAMSGLLFFILYPAVVVFLLTVYKEEWIGFFAAFVMILIGCLNYIVIISSIITFITELIKKHRLKNSFFKTNKLYSFFFYIGILLNFLIFVVITLIILSSYRPDLIKLL